MATLKPSCFLPVQQIASQVGLYKELTFYSPISGLMFLHCKTQSSILVEGPTSQRY